MMGGDKGGRHGLDKERGKGDNGEEGAQSVASQAKEEGHCDGGGEGGVGGR